MNAPLPAPAPQPASRPALALSPTAPAALHDLPPSARRPPPWSPWPASRHKAESIGRSKWSLAALALAGAAGLSALLLGMDGSNEASARNWRHHAQTVEQRDQAGNRPEALKAGMKWVAPMGAARFQNAVPLAVADADLATTREVLAALHRFDQTAADAAVQAAQVGLTGDPLPNGEPAAVPSLTPGMREELRRGDACFYHIFLYDSCDEDGDVVDILIDGHRFATVPITRQGTTLSLPLGVGRPTSVVVRGVYDGGGGITVACQTSRGEGFVRPLEVAEEQPLAFVVE